MVLIASGHRPARLQLPAWYTEPDTDELAGHVTAATEEVHRATAGRAGETRQPGRSGYAPSVLTPYYPACTRLTCPRTNSGDDG